MHFFKLCNDYITEHIEKLNQGSLHEYYSAINYTDEISKVSYTIDKNLEKQLVTLLRNLCTNGNREMQNYLRNQVNSQKSYNLVNLCTTYAGELCDHLQYPVAYDNFQTVLSALLEFIEGPNVKNQNILINLNFVGMAKKILDLDYHERNRGIKDRVCTI